MKKINYLFLGLAGLALASCSQDDLTNPGTPEGYSLTVSLPADMATRAIGDVATGTNYNLTYYLYDKDGDYIKMTTESTTITVGTPATVNLPLVKGNSYTVVFFAQSAASSNVYTLNAEEGTMTVYYSEMKEDYNAADDYDCFYANYPINNVGENISDKVQLTRPMAQINWGTNDLNEPSVKDAFKDMATTLKMEANNVLNLLDGTVSRSTTADEIIYEGFETSAYSMMTYPDVSGSTGSTYEYLAMQYVLAGAASTTNNLTLTVGGNLDGAPIEIDVTNVPLQANYRTNIYGSLLTDQASLSVEVNADWYGNFLNPQDFGDEIDGSGLYLNTTTKTYAITSVSALQKMSEISNQTGATLQNYTMVLTIDLDLKGVEYTPIKNSLGNFDGQGHTISNLTITGTDNVGFLSQSNGTLQNVNFKNANITGNKFVGVAVGYNNCGKINNVTVDGATVTCKTTNNGSVYDDGNKAGGIAGYLISGGATAYITNCTVNDVTVTGYREVGAITGYAQVYEDYPCYINNCSATNCNITANQQLPEGGSYVSTKPFYAGEISGYWDTGVNQSNNTATNVAVTTVSADGTYGISTPAAWIQHSKTFNSRPGTGKLQLNNSLDFEGATVSNFFFAGTFNGNGYTMSNMTLSSTDAYSMGLFNRDAISGTLTVENVTFENINITNPDTSQGYVGVICGDIQNSSTVNLNNVHVINANFKGVKATGGLVGLVAASCTLNVTDCSVTNSYLTNFNVPNESGFVCGMVGRVNISGTINFNGNNSVSNSKIVGYWAPNRGEASIAAVAAQYSTSGGTINGLSNVTVTNVTVTPIPAGN